MAAVVAKNGIMEKKKLTFLRNGKKSFLKKNWSQMIHKCLIHREMAKTNWRQMAVFGGSGGTAAVFFKVSKNLCLFLLMFQD